MSIAHRLRADFRFRVRTTAFSIAIEMLSNQQSKPDISHIMKGVSIKGYGIGRPLTYQ